MSQMTLRAGRFAPSQRTVHIALDFGTTFSGAAYGIDHGTGKQFDIRDIHIVSKYSDGDPFNHLEVNQVPTEILYREGEKKPLACGWEARSILKESTDREKFRLQYAKRFKLLLSKKDYSCSIRKELEENILCHGRTTHDLIVDYLTPLRTHILDYIQCEDDEDEFHTWKRVWTLTVPADWSALARRQMQEAAKDAGFEGGVKLISEPEAAALYILEKRADEKRKLNLEDAAVVGDLGGGTIDCATYLTSSLDPLSLAALGSVKGRIVGSSNLNDAFRRSMRLRLEAVRSALEQDSGKPFDRLLDDVVDWFELAKRTFRGPEQSRRKSHAIQVPVSWLQEDLERGFDKASLGFSSVEMLTIFDQVIDQIIELLREQVEASVLYRQKTLSRSQFKIEKIFLTGGLAAKKYVEKRVKDAFLNPRVVNYPIPVVVAPNSQTAVVQGAVWRSLHPTKITKRVSETSYGFARDESWGEDWSHGGPGHVRNPLTGALEVKDRMKWVIKKGAAFSDGLRAPYRLERYVPVGGPLKFTETLWYSDSISVDHIYYKHPDIHQLGTLDFDLESWRDRFQVTENSRGVEYMMIEYDLISVVSEDDWSYEIEVLGGKTNFKGSKNIVAGFKLSQGIVQD